MKLHVQFLTSVVDAGHFPPPTVPEVAFLGRSNVGKSSLLNSLIDSKVAYVGSTPGRTRSINFFSVRAKAAKNSPPDLLLADLPGYGYAKISRSISAGWPRFIDPYLKDRESLGLCVVLVDANVPAQNSDMQLLKFLRAAGRRLIVVATKTDRLSKNKLKPTLAQLAKDLGGERILAYSAKTRAGRSELWAEIRSALPPS